MSGTRNSSSSNSLQRQKHNDDDKLKHEAAHKATRDGSDTISTDMLAETIAKQNELSRNMAAMIADSLKITDKPTKSKPNPANGWLMIWDILTGPRGTSG